MQKHQEKVSFEITNVSDYSEDIRYIFMKDGFNIKDGQIFFDLDNKRKYDNLLNTCKLHTFRIKYNSYSRFFGLEELSNEIKNNLLDYSIFDVIKKDKTVFQKVPLNTMISTKSNKKKNLNNYILKINYNDMVKTTFDLPNNPIVEYEKEDGNIIHYINEANTLLFNSKDNKYLNIKDVIANGLLKYMDSFTIPNTSITAKNALIYNNQVVGTIENQNKIFINDSLIPSINIHGSNLEIDIGLNATLENSEEILYYPEVDKLIGKTSYNEYVNGDVIYFKDNNTLNLLTKEGIKNITLDNIIYSYDVPDSYDNADLWYDMSMSCIRLYDGFNWKNLSRPSLETICKKIELDNKYLNSSDNYLEVYGYDSTEEFMTLEMTISNEIAKDIQFKIDDNFIQSVFINGTEIYDYKEAAYGIHLLSPLLKSDLVQIIMSKDKEYEWVTGNVLNNTTISLSYPFDINHVRKLLINDIEYTVLNVDQNKIHIKDLKESRDQDIILNTCDRVVAKVRKSESFSKAYPDFIVNYEPNTKVIKLPFNISENRFDQIMITNNSKEVIINPEVIYFPDDLYAYYSVNNPYEVSFNRYIQETDSIVIQFVKHEPCSFNPESMFDGQNTLKDISDKLILDSITNFEDPKLQLNYILQKIEENIVENNVVDKIYDEIIIGGITMDNKTEEEKLQELIDSVAKPSNPDISENIIVNKPMPPNIDDPILARPSNTIVRPVINIVSKNPAKNNKYNLEFTNNYMSFRNDLKSYLFDINRKFSQTVWELTNLRNALREMIHYLCNTLCLKEIVKTIMEAFNALTSGLASLMDLISSDMLDKLKGLGQSLKDAFKNGYDKFKNMASDLIGLAKDKLMEYWGAFKTLTGNLIDKGLNMISGALDKINAIIDSVMGIYNKFKKTKIGLNIGKFKMPTWKLAMPKFSNINWPDLKFPKWNIPQWNPNFNFKGFSWGSGGGGINWKGLKSSFGKMKKNMFDSIGKSLNKVGQFMKDTLNKIKDALGNIGSNLKEMWDKLKNFDYKSMFKSLTIENIIDFICKKLLQGLLDMLDGTLDVLRHLQRRFQNFIYKAFADNYRSPFKDLDYLKTLSNFFRSHINICNILREMWGKPDTFTLAAFIKRVTNLDRIFSEWKHNKRIIKNMAGNFNPLNNGSSSNRGKITDLAGVGNALTNSILMMDEMAGINEKTIERIIANLKRAFSINFKTTIGSILDKQAMSKQIFDPKKFNNLAKKIVPF